MNTYCDHALINAHVERLFTPAVTDLARDPANQEISIHGRGQVYVDAGRPIPAGPSLGSDFGLPTADRQERAIRRTDIPFPPSGDQRRRGRRAGERCLGSNPAMPLRWRGRRRTMDIFQFAMDTAR
jgi:hypothetical protein